MNEKIIQIAKELDNTKFKVKAFKNKEQKQVKYHMEIDVTTYVVMLHQADVEKRSVEEIVTKIKQQLAKTILDELGLTS